MKALFAWVFYLTVSVVSLIVIVLVVIRMVDTYDR